MKSISSKPSGGKSIPNFASNHFANPVKQFDAKLKPTQYLPYNHKVSGEYHGFPRTDIISPLAFGVELEVECADGYTDYNYHYITAVNNALSSSGGENFAICKRDGSLKGEGRYGFEICTNPASIPFHRQAWKNFFLNSFGARLSTSERTGLHIHVSKDAISRLSAGKILQFIHNPENRKFLRKVAGRKSNQYANYDAELGIRDVKKRFDHYAAVNTSLSFTIEFRIFSATLNYDRFMSYLEFVDALIRFASTTDCAKSKNKRDFLAFLNLPKNRLDYRNIIHYLYTNGYSESLLPINSKVAVEKPVAENNRVEVSNDFFDISGI